MNGVFSIRPDRRGVLIAALTVAALLAPAVPAEVPRDDGVLFSLPAPELSWARMAAVLEVASDTILYELRGTEPWPPASLTKLVTIYAALEASEEGEFSLQEPQTVHPAGYASAQPPGSSLMFLGPDQRVSGLDLIRGLAISSGNDAAVETALRVSGGVGPFNVRLNDLSRRLGYDAFYFEDPAGLSPANRITATGIARFSRDLVERWPWLLQEVFSLPEFSYPLQEHLVGSSGGGTIRQFNRNGLVGTFDGADGLKTGFIEESGYNIAVTAQRDGRRLIAVVLGVPGTSHTEGGRRRDGDAAALLEWGFSSYDLVPLRTPELEPVELWGARQDAVRPLAADGGPVSVPRGAAERIRGEVDQREHLWAPVPAGTPVGTVRYLMDDVVLREVPVTIGEEIPAAGWVRRAIDRIRWWFSGLFGRR